MSKAKKFADGGFSTAEDIKESGVKLRHPVDHPGDDPDAPETDNDSGNSDVKLNEPSYQKGGKVKNKFKRGGKTKKEIKAEGEKARSHMGKPARK